MGFSLKSEREHVVKESVHPMHTRYGGREPHALTDSANRKQLPKDGWQLEGRVARPAPEGGRCELMGWKNKRGRRPWVEAALEGSQLWQLTQETQGASHDLVARVCAGPSL